MNKINFHSIAAIVVLLLTSSVAFGEDGIQVKWTGEVGAVIKPLSVDAKQPAGGARIVTFTYEAVKQCKQLSLFGHSYSKDGIQLPLFMLTQKSDVALGQKFRDQVVVTYEPGHYVVLDKVYCMESR